MSMFSIFNVTGSAISAQAQRLNVVASNMANAEAVAGPNGQGYKARMVTFQTMPMGGEGNALSGCRGLRDALQRQSRRGNGQHDFCLSLVSKQRRGDEHRQNLDAKDPANGPVIAIATKNKDPSWQPQSQTP